MPVPESTSAEAYEQYIGGNCIRASHGDAWREIKAFVIASPRVVEFVQFPAVSEAFLAWTMSGEAEFQERENSGPWVSNRINRGSFFLTTGGGNYDCRWKTLNSEPFQTMLVFLELPLLKRAFEEVFTNKAPQARLKDLSAFRDNALQCFMEQLHAELMRESASPLYVQGLAQALTIHLVRNYAEIASEARTGSPSLPGFKLRQILDWMSAHLDQELSLDELAQRAGLSKFHFLRLFKTATGSSPSRYHTQLRMDAARQLLRETKKDVIEVALELGYKNPSHFARVFRRQAGLSPSDYRQQR